MLNEIIQKNYDNIFISTQIITMKRIDHYDMPSQSTYNYGDYISPNFQL